MYGQVAPNFFLELLQEVKLVKKGGEVIVHPLDRKT